MQERDWIFDDLNRELINRFPFAIANSYDEFVSIMLSAIQEALNSPAGQELIEPMRQEAIRQKMDPAEWQKHKVNIMIVLFFLMLEELPMLRHEMSRHLYRELRKESRS